MRLPRYQSYKDSGISWVGAIPSAWRVQPLIGIACERNESNFGMVEDNLLSLSYGRIVRKDIESNDGLLPESFETYQVVQPGDIVLRLTDLQNDKRSLRSARVEERGIITSAYAAIRPSAIDSRFLAHLMRAYDLTKVFYSMGGGLRQSMKFGDLKRMPIICPPSEEQAAIADFLDRETAKIDALIAEQEKLIALLGEKRQATISLAVTLGLDLSAQTKDSGVEWLGEIPSHWTTAKLAHIARQIVDGAHFTPTYVDEGAPFLRVTDITRPSIELSEVKRIPLAEHDELIRRCRPEKGDLLLSKNGTIGIPKVVTWDWPFSIFVSLCLIKLRSEIVPSFAAYVFQSSTIKIQIDEGSKQSTVTNLHLEKIREFRMPLPPIDEQHQIVAWLDRKVGAIDSLLANAEKAISLLHERRSALVTSAVTGQIDVLGAHIRVRP